MLHLNIFKAKNLTTGKSQTLQFSCTIQVNNNNIKETVKHAINKPASINIYIHLT